MALRINKRKIFHLSTLSLLLGISQHAFSWGLYIPLESISNLGEEFSGGAAAVQDASTNYLNPAGLTLLGHQQLVVGGTAVSETFDFKGSMTSTSLLLPPPFPGPSVTAQTGHSSKSPRGFLPLFHYAYPVTKNIAVGLSVIEPYGLGLSYGNMSLLRYNVINATDVSYDISPSIAFQVMPQFSVAAGIDAVYFDITQKLAVNTTPLTFGDSYQTNEASSWNYGWHAGALYQPTEQTRIGLSFHSAVIENMHGSSRFYTSSGLLSPTGSVVSTGNLKIRIPLASVTNLSLYHDINPDWAMMATVGFLGWGIYKFDHETNLATPSGLTNQTTTRKLHNAWLFALGTNYHLNDKWMLRGGINYTQGSTDNTNRDVYITDPDTFNLAVGTHYQPNASVGLDLAYGYSFFKHVTITHTPIPGATLNGTSKESGLGVLGAQLVWNIA